MSTQILQQGTPEWLEAREGRINASELGAILNVSPFTGPKVMLRNKVANKPFFKSEAMQWGTDNEHTARTMYEFLYGPDSKVEQTGYWAIELDGIPLGASPDGLVDGGLVEIKCPWKLREQDKPQFDSIEDLPHYWHQIQLQLLATDRHWCDFFQWAPNGFKCERVERDPDWWGSVKADVSKFHAAYLKAVEAVGEPDPIGETARFKAAAEAYLMAKQAKLHAESDMGKARKAMLELCEAGESDSVVGGGLSIQRVSSKGTLDYKGWAKDNDYTVPEEYRKAGTTSWRINETGDEK